MGQWRRARENEPMTSRIQMFASLLLGLVCVVSSSAPRAEITQAARLDKDYPVQPVPFTDVRLSDGFWAPKIETNRTATIPAAFEQCELDRARGQLHSRGHGVARRAAREHEAAGLSVRRHRSLQSDRRRVVRPRGASRSETRRVRGQPDREDHRGAGKRRLPVHDAHDQSRRAASVGRHRAVAAREGRQP